MDWAFQFYLKSSLTSNDKSDHSATWHIVNKKCKKPDTLALHTFWLLVVALFKPPGGRMMYGWSTQNVHCDAGTKCLVWQCGSWHHWYFSGQQRSSTSQLNQLQIRIWQHELNGLVAFISSCVIKKKQKKHTYKNFTLRYIISNPEHTGLAGSHRKLLKRKS